MYRHDHRETTLLTLCRTSTTAMERDQEAARQPGLEVPEADGRPRVLGTIVMVQTPDGLQQTQAASEEDLRRAIQVLREIFAMDSRSQQQLSEE